MLVRQDFFDRTVDAKGMKAKDSSETKSNIEFDYKKTTQKIGATKEKILLENLKKFAAQKECTFTLQ